MYKLDTVVWEITLRCNINCLHCGSKADLNTRPNELSTEEALSLIEQLADLNCRRIVLSGGEPYMRPDWAVLGKRIKDLGIRLGIISNGFAINDNTLDVLYYLSPNSLSFSLDGGNAKTHDYIRGKEGVFDHLIYVIKKLIERGLFVSIVTSIHKQNIAELPQMLNLLLELGVPAWQIQTVTPQGRMPRELAVDSKDFYQIAEFIVENRQKYKNLIKIMEADAIGYFSKLSPYMDMKVWQGCQAGLKVLGIESDGTIKGCLSLQNDRFIEGNIREKSLAEIWNNPENFSYNRRFTPSMLEGICKNCKYGQLCRGGCTEKAVSYTGNPHESPFCLYHIETNCFE